MHLCCDLEAIIKAQSGECFVLCRDVSEAMIEVFVDKS